MRLRSILFLTLFGFLATAKPFGSGQIVGVTSSETVMKMAQIPWPPPPECGLYSTCKAKAKA